MKRIALLVSLLFIAVIAAEISHAEYGDIVLGKKMESMEKAGVKPVMFPHWFHRIRFKCKVCHEDIFILQRGANDINMNAIISGEFCGKCHNGFLHGSLSIATAVIHGMALFHRTRRRQNK